MVVALHALALLLYVAAAFVLARSLAEGRRAAPVLAAVLTFGALLVHAAALAAFTADFAEPPLVGLAPSLSTLGLLIGAFLLGAGLMKEARPLGLILLPLVTLLVTLALVLGLQPAAEIQAYRSLWFRLHIFLAFVGIAGFSLAFAAGLLYLLQFRQLKRKSFGRMFRFFPPLETLDLIGRWALAIGFPALSLALLLAWAWSERFHNPPEMPKIAWAAASWLVFAVVLAARFRGAGAERRGAVASVVGFALVALAYVALRLTTGGGGVFL